MTFTWFLPVCNAVSWDLSNLLIGLNSLNILNFSFPLRDIGKCWQEVQVCERKNRETFLKVKIYLGTRMEVFGKKWCGGCIET